MDESTRQLVDILQSAGHEPYAYSGRGMYGKECVGVDLHCEVLNFAADVIEAMAICGEADENGEMVAKALRNARSDSMGRGTVVYFPRFAATSDDLPKDN
jgi:hypothetical protein